MNPSKSDQAQALVEVLRLLAMEPDDQIAALPPFVDVPDELALLFGDQCDVLGHDDLEAAVGKEAATIIREIESVFESMAGKEEFFTLEALRSASEWTRIRARSTEALNVAGLSLGPPDLSWVRYVPGR